MSSSSSSKVPPSFSGPIPWHNMWMTVLNLVSSALGKQPVARATIAGAVARTPGMINHNSTEFVCLLDLPGHRVRRQGAELAAVTGPRTPPGRED